MDPLLTPPVSPPMRSDASSPTTSTPTTSTPTTSSVTTWTPPTLDPPSPAVPTTVAPSTVAPGKQNGRARFGAGLVVGAAVTAAALGGYVVGQGDSTSESAVATPPIAAQTVASQSGSISDLVQAVRPAVVSVHQSVTRSGTGQQGRAAGTGFVLTADGFIVTNNHVVAEGDDTTVTFADGTSESATIVAADPSRDLAVLKVDRADLQPLAVGNSDDLAIGEQLVAVGYALDLDGEPSVTSGILSAKERTITSENGVQLVNLLQTDTAINPGNSGGPLLNTNGEVVGINTAIAGQAQNIGFAIAITPVMNVIDSLQAGTVPDRALMGVTTQPATDQQGAEIIEIAPGSGAADSTLRVGDVITAVDGDDITEPSSLGASIARYQPGDTVTVTVDRNGQTSEATVTLGTRPT
jgi:putative serine protease PepD